MPAFGQFENPGLHEQFVINTGGYDFTVTTTSNFQIEEIILDEEKKMLTFSINSNVERNLGEIEIPINLINGNFTFFLNDQEIFPVVKDNQKISFITVEFEGKGRHTLEAIGTTYLPEFSEIAPMVLGLALIGILLLKFKKTGI